MNEQYKVKLADFEGPLDLLLYLVRESKLDIKTLHLSEVTAQYLAFLGELDTLDLDLASEFIEVAATLIEIKSRGILPRPIVEEDPEDIEKRLLGQLEAYKILKEASEQLKTIENVDRFYKEPVDFQPEYKFVLNNLSMDMLTAAFAKIMHRIRVNTEAIVGRQIRMDRFTVKEKMADIKNRLLGQKNNESDTTPALLFFDLFETDFTKSEMINTFLALLELLKTGDIKAVQESIFSDITILAAQNSCSTDNGGNE